MAKGRFNRVGHLFVICMRTETELALSLVFFFFFFNNVVGYYCTFFPPLSVPPACNTRTNVGVHPRTHTHSVAHTDITHKAANAHTFHTHHNTIRNSFDFSHSRRLGHKRLCWFEPAWTRFYRLQRKQITTCIEFCIG